MSDLHDLQRRVAVLVMQPLTRDDKMRRRTAAGGLVNAEAEALIKPNQRLSSLERLEIYNRQYWFRVLSCFAEDFPGLRAIVGARKFEGLMRTYLADCPSVSFTLRNLGSRLEGWLRSHPDWIAPRETLALNMVQLEWAHIETFDGESDPKLTLADIEALGVELRISLQPHIRLLELTYPVDDLLIEVHNYEGDTDTSSNSARQQQFRRRVRHYQQPEAERIYLAVHRQDDIVYYKRLQAESYRMLQALSQHKQLEEAIDLAFENSSMAEAERIDALQRWFRNWAELGWFCRPKLTLFKA
jgi:hypothetical protein